MLARRTLLGITCLATACGAVDAPRAVGQTTELSVVAKQPMRYTAPRPVRYQDLHRPHTGRAGSASLEARALIGSDGRTELEVSTQPLDQRPGLAPGNIGSLRWRVEDRRGRAAFHEEEHLHEGGDVVREIAGLSRGERLRVVAHVTGIDPRRVDVVEVETSVRRRPDLSVTVVEAPTPVAANVPVTISATVRELNLDVGATADCVLAIDGADVDRADGIWIDAGGTVSCAFVHAFALVGPHSASVRVEHAVPADDRASDDSAGTQIVVQPQERELAYTASFDDLQIADYSAEVGSYLSDDAAALAEPDYSQSTEQFGWSQSVSVTAWSTRGAEFPLDLAVLERGASGASITVGAAAVMPDDSFESPNGMVRCAARQDDAQGALLTVCTYDHFTNLQYRRFAGDVTYRSSGFDRYWSGAGDSGQPYFWNHAARDVTGGRLPVTDSVMIRVAVTDAEVEAVAVAKIALTETHAQVAQPETCTDVTVKGAPPRHSCSVSLSDHVEKQGTASGDE